MHITEERKELEIKRRKIKAVGGWVDGWMGGWAVGRQKKGEKAKPFRQSCPIRAQAFAIHFISFLFLFFSIFFLSSPTTGKISH
jgi:hypothetical protein